MAKKYHVLLFILCLGIFLSPSSAKACATKTLKQENTCCKKYKKEKTNCCPENSKDQEKDDSDGTCRNPNCSCPTAQFVYLLPSLADLNAKFSEVFEFEKSIVFFKETYISTGYIFIWSPPNIG